MEYYRLVWMNWSGEEVSTLATSTDIDYLEELREKELSLGLDTGLILDIVRVKRNDKLSS